MNKRGISLLVSYSILVVIAIALSVLVYSSLKLYLPTDRPECSPDIKLIVEEATCQAGTLDLTLSNRGLFNVQGAFIRLGPEGRTVLSQANIPGEEIFLDPITPGVSLQILPILQVSNIVDISGPYTLEIQPAIIEKGAIYPCEKSVIRQTISCSLGAAPTCGTGHTDNLDDTCTAILTADDDAAAQGYQTRDSVSTNNFNSWSLARNADEATSAYGPPSVGTSFDFDGRRLYNVRRGQIYIDTSSIPDGSIITDTSLYLYGTIDRSDTDIDIWAVEGTMTNPVDDMQNDWFNDFVGWSSSGTYLVNKLHETAWNTFNFLPNNYISIDFNSNGNNYIKTTIETDDTAQIVLISDDDINDKEILVAENRWVAFSDTTTGGNPPYLEITYTLPLA
jgi:hypothetical protein